MALKVLPAGLAKNPIVLQRFLREARSAESLEHPNIVSIYDRGIDRGRHYLVLEYVRGSDLHDYIQRRGPLSVAEAIKVIRQVAEGLGYAAERGLVHRDIKPSNILRSDSGEIKITDLGLALQIRIRGRAGHARRDDGRHGRLHGPRAGSGQPGGELPERPLLAGLHLLLPAHRHPSVIPAETSPTS